METVQMYLAQLDKERLAKTYYSRIKPIENNSEEVSNHGYFYTHRNKIYEFIDKMVNTKITNQDKKNKAIIIAYKFFDRNDEGFLDYYIQTNLVYEKDLKENKFQASTYAYEFKPQSEIAGFYIANTKYANDNIYDVLADILYEASFFGYDQEDKEKIETKINEAVEEIQNGTYSSKPINFDEERKKHGIPAISKIEKGQIHMDIECNNYLYKVELKKVMDLLGIEY